MNQTYFNKKNSLSITSSDTKNEIKTLIKNIGYFSLTSKYYTFLNKKNVNNLKENNFLVTLSTFGKKYVLFITKFNNKKYCIFINKKNDIMTITQLKFTDDIFIGTLFDGELVKNYNNKWIFLINDIAYYKGVNLITKSFFERRIIINNILKSEHENDNYSLFITKKEYFEYNKINDLVDNYMKVLSYKCSGLYFKSINNFSDNYLFIFPECRSDTKILNNMNIDDNMNVGNNINVCNNNTNIENVNLKKFEVDNNEDDDNLFNDVEIIKQEQVEPIKYIKKPSSNNNLKLEKTTCRFLIHPTLMPDIYELYSTNSNNSIEKYSYASVPDIDTSNLLKAIIGLNYDLKEDIKTRFENNNAIFVECNYHKNFKKWIPFKKVDSMDNITTINQIQIILDSL
jgi:hypothetical protein